MKHPERRAQQGDIFDKDAVAVHEVHHLWAQTIFFVKAALVHIHAVLCLFQQECPAAVALADGALGPSVVWSAAPFPPCVVGAATIDDPLAGDGYVGLLVGIDKR